MQVVVGLALEDDVATVPAFVAIVPALVLVCLARAVLPEVHSADNVPPDGLVGVVPGDALRVHFEGKKEGGGLCLNEAPGEGVNGYRQPYSTSAQNGDPTPQAPSSAG